MFYTEECPFKGNNYCELDHNIEGCEFDGGDCCQDSVECMLCYRPVRM